jgi:hypothetical protein
MRNLSLKFMAVLYVLFVMASVPLNGASTDFIENYDQSIVGDRIYIASEDLLITKYGIFLMSSGEALPLTAIYVDSQGIYIKKEDKIYDTCLNGHKIYHQACGGCANWWCAFRCKCCSPW